MTSTELEFIIVEIRGDIAFGFDKASKDLFKIKIPAQLRVSNIISFNNAAAIFKDETYYPHANSVKIRDAKKGDCCFNVKGKLYFSAYFACSKNRNHKSHEKKVAFADWYGYVDISRIPNNLIEWNVVYKTNLVVNDLEYKKNGTLLFKSEQKEKLVQAEQSHHFIDSMEDFENEYMELENRKRTTSDEEPSRKGGNGTTRSEIPSKTRIHNPFYDEPRNIQPSYELVKRDLEADQKGKQVNPPDGDKYRKNIDYKIESEPYVYVF